MLLLPSSALAAAGPAVLSLRDGIPAELLGKTMGVAFGLFALSLIAGLLAEAFGGSPTESKNYGGVVFRSVVVIALLSGYPVLFGSVINTAQGIADRIAPASIWTAFGEHNIRSIEALRRQSAAAETAEEAEASGLTGWVTSSGAMVKGYVGGALFDGLVLVFVALGQACHWAFGQLSRILVTVLYLLGPIALVFHIPGPAGVAGRWFRSFVTVACWPIFSALLLAIAHALLLRTDTAAVFGEYGTAFGALGTTVLMAAMCLATPMLASATVGGSLKNLPMASLMAATLGAGAIAKAMTARKAGLPGAGTPGPGGALAGGAGGPGPIGGGASGPQASRVGPIAVPPAPSGGVPLWHRSHVPAGAPVGSGRHGPTEPLVPAVGVPPSNAVPMQSAPKEGPPTTPGGRGIPAAARVYPGVRDKAKRAPGLGTDELRFKGPEPAVPAPAVPPHPADPPPFHEPTAALPRKFKPADWSDVGRSG